MRKAVIDQILLWIVLFVSFVTIFYFVIDYYNIIKAKDKCDALANYGVRMKALGKSDSDIVIGLNSLKGSYFATIYDANLTCTALATEQYQVIFTTNITFKNQFLEDGEKIYSIATAFNEVSSTDQNCTLDLSTQ
ncbi:MAG: hypothetical protein KAQ94_02160 [Arcobacteraceae bacterium]|nr:hypothetical protein [Arcobacteraceae bacterium]